MRGHKAQPPQTGNGIEGGHQFGKALTTIGIAIGIDVLAEQRHLANPALNQPFDVGNDLADGAADFAAAYEGDNAIGAHLVTATQYKNIGEHPTRGWHRHGPVEVIAVARLHPSHKAFGLTNIEYI